MARRLGAGVGRTTARALGWGVPVASGSTGCREPPVGWGSRPRGTVELQPLVGEVLRSLVAAGRGPRSALGRGPRVVAVPVSQSVDARARLRLRLRLGRRHRRGGCGHGRRSFDPWGGRGGREGSDVVCPGLPRTRAAGRLACCGRREDHKLSGLHGVLAAAGNRPEGPETISSGEDPVVICAQRRGGHSSALAQQQDFVRLPGGGVRPDVDAHWVVGVDQEREPVAAWQRKTTARGCRHPQRVPHAFTVRPVTQRVNPVGAASPEWGRGMPARARTVPDEGIDLSRGGWGQRTRRGGSVRGGRKRAGPVCVYGQHLPVGVGGSAAAWCRRGIARARWDRGPVGGNCDPARIARLLDRASPGRARRGSSLTARHRRTHRVGRPDPAGGA